MADERSSRVGEGSSSGSTAPADGFASAGWLYVLIPVALLLLAFVVRLLGAQTQAVWVDELYHVIAGRSLNEGHGLSLYEGVYPRVAAFTSLVALFTSNAAGDMILARMPAILSGSILVSYMYIHVKHTVGFIAGVSVALLICFSALSIEQSSYVRFYSIHALLFSIAAMTIYDVLTKPISTRSLFTAAVASVALAGALYLQVITIFAVIGIFAWGGVYLLSGSSAISKNLRKPIILVPALLLLSAASLIVIYLIRHKLADALDEYLSAQQWNRRAQHDYLFYIRYIWTQYPLLAILFPAAIFAALKVNRLFCTYILSIIISTMLFLSFGGMKTPRYLTFVLPLVFVIYGMALAGLYAWLRKRTDRVESTRSSPLHRWAPALVVFASVVAIFAFDKGLRAPVKGVLQDARSFAIDDGFVFHPPPDEPFRSKRSQVLAVVRESDLFVTTDEFRSILYLGGFDVALVPGFDNDEGRADFRRDRRTGRPRISSAESLALLMRCYPSGVILAMNDKWPAPNEIDPDVTALMDTLPAPEVITTPGRPQRFYLFRWRTNEVGKDPGCAQARELISKDHVSMGRSAGNAT